MSSTISVLNTSGLPGNTVTGLFVYGSETNPLAAVQVGWYAQGPGSINGLITSIIDSGVSVLIQVTSPAFFTSGELYSFTAQQINSNPPCFKEGTQILCFKDNKEVYRVIQDLRPGDLVKTHVNGYLKIDMIGTSLFYNSQSSERFENKLYKCSMYRYSELTDDLYITGTHSILVDSLTREEQDKTVKSLGKLFLTGSKWRLMAFIDIRTDVVTDPGVCNIYHLALENEVLVGNYGIYANGLLVESCSKNYLRQRSNMTLLNLSK
jgi:hypothetical protein